MSAGKLRGAGSAMSDGLGSVALASAIVRVQDAAGQAVGAGFLVTTDLVVTCAHVVSAALGLAEEQPPGQALVTVDLPLGGPDADQSVVLAGVEHWSPPQPTGAGDIAVLRLASPLPGARPTRLVEAEDVWGHLMRTFGFPAARPHGVWHVGRLRGRQAAGWVQADLAHTTGYRVTRGFSGGPVWDEELAGVVGMIVVAEAGDPPASYLIPTDALLAAYPPLRHLVLPRSPFRGLAAFRESDAEVFYGRAAESGELADLVRAEPVVTLVGPSGSGKSSLAMAGVIPRLRKAGYAAAVLRPTPGRGPLYALAAELLALLEPEASEVDRLQDTPALAEVLATQGLAPVLPRVLDRTGSRRLLVVVDQFEELLAQQPDAIDAVAALLLDDNRLPQLRILVTLRVDLLDAVLAHPRLGPALRRRLWALGPFQRDQLRQVIAGPVAHLPGIEYEPGLVDRILADTGAEPGSLPLLGLTLALLWERQSAGKLTHDAYESLGGVAGAVARHAEAVWREEVPPADEAAARRLFTQLVRASGPTGAVTRRVATRGELGDHEWRIAQRLATTRLLVAGRDATGAETVELAHEALIAAWPRLAAWVAADREFLGWRETVRSDMRRWQQASHDPELLPTAATLAGAERWLSERPSDLGAAEHDYLERGRRFRRGRARRRRVLMSVLSGVLVVAVMLASLYLYQRRVSGQQTAAAESRALAAASVDLAPQDPVRSIMLALAAYRRSSTEDARNALLRHYAWYRSTHLVLSAPFGGLTGVQASRDGRVVVARTEGGRAYVFVRGADGGIRSEHLAAVQTVHATVTPAGNRVAYLRSDGSVVWYDVIADGDRLLGREHRIPAVPQTHDNASGTHPGETAISADGRLFAVVTGKNVLWWDLAAGAFGGRLALPSAGWRFWRVWFGPDQDTIVAQVSVSDGFDRVVALNRFSGASRVIADRVHGAVVSGDGAAVVTCRDEDAIITYTRYRVADAVEQGRYVSKGSDHRSCMLLLGTMATDMTGRTVVTEDPDDSSQWLRVDVVAGRVLSAAVPDAGTHWTADRLVEADGKLFLVKSGDETGIVFLPVPEFDEVEEVTQATLTADGKRVVTVARGGTHIRLRHADLADGSVLAESTRPRPHWDPTNDRVKLNRDGSLLADRVGSNRISIREVATLAQVAEITTAMPPRVGGEPPQLTYFFDDPDHLVTLAGTRIERWHLGSGQRQQQADLAALGLLKNASAQAGGITLSGYPEPGHVAAVVWGEPKIHVLDLRAGRLVAALDTGSDTIAVNFDSRSPYFAVMRRGRVIELWRREPLRKELGPFASIGNREAMRTFVAAFVDDGDFLLAANNSVRIYRTGETISPESFQLGWPVALQETVHFRFFDVSADGKTILYAGRGSIVETLSLRPADWQAKLCELIGHREFTDEERQLVPAKIPPGSLCS